MFLSLDLANLALYCAQQLGVALGLGAQSILLVAYLQAMRDGVIDPKEAQFSRAVRSVLNVSLLLIIVSGLGIGALEIVEGSSTILEPAYLFKWALVIFILLLNVFSDAIPPNLLEGLRGGSWFALFIIHILAPVTSWMNLLTLYALWMVGFNLAWMALLPLTHERKKMMSVAAKPEAKLAPPAKKIESPKAPPPPTKPAPAPVPAVPKPIAALPIVQPLEIDKPAHFIPPKVQTPPPPPLKPTPPPAPARAPTPAPAPTQPPLKSALETIPVAKQPQDPWLPAIKVMPKSPQDVATPQK